MILFMGCAVKYAIKLDLVVLRDDESGFIYFYIIE
jgi:hypothetical protein